MVRKALKKSLTSGAFADHPGLLAFLVNESRSRRSDLSADPFSDDWVKSYLRPRVTALWNEYAKTVYPYDDIVLSVRNQFFLRSIDDLTSSGHAAVIILPCGFTSYPYLLAPAETVEFVECDLPEVIDYKKLRAEELIAQKIIPPARVSFQAMKLDFGHSLTSLMETLDREQRWIWIMEGISYYINSEIWASICGAIADRSKAGDHLIFDYWSARDQRKVVYERFLKFCRRHSGYNIDSFSFLDERRISEWFTGHRVTFSDVVEQEIVLCHSSELQGKRNLLRDRYAAVRFR